MTAKNQNNAQQSEKAEAKAKAKAEANTPDETPGENPAEEPEVPEEGPEEEEPAVEEKPKKLKVLKNDGSQGVYTTYVGQFVGISTKHGEFKKGRTVVMPKKIADELKKTNPGEFEFKFS